MRAVLFFVTLITTVLASGHSRQFTVLSYNIKGLPSYIVRDQDRFREIGRLLARDNSITGKRPNVVLLQEAFSFRTRELNLAANYKHALLGPGSNIISGINYQYLNSGLVILSDFALKNSKSIAYGSNDCGGFDCFANKGAMIVELQVPGVPFPILISNTHLQAHRDQEAPRNRQMRTLWSFLKKDAGRWPLIAAGDYNSNPSRPGYHRWMKNTGFTNAGEVCALLDNCEYIGQPDPDGNYGKFWLRSHDQFFYLNATDDKHISIQPLKVQKIFNTPIKGRLLSDHDGYLVTFEVKWND